MTKRRKKKTGLHKKVPSVFEGVLIPDHKGDRETGLERASDGSQTVPSRQTATDSLVSKSSLMKSVRRSKTSSGAIATDPVHTILSERQAPKSPVREVPPQPQLDHAEDKPDKTAQDHVDVPSTPTGLQHIVPPSLSAKEPKETKNSPDGASPERRASVPPKLTTPDRPAQERTPEQESSPTENLPDKADRGRTVETPPKLTTPDPLSSERPPESELQKTDEPSDEAAQDLKLGTLPWLMSPGDPDAKDTPAEQPAQKDEPSHKGPLDRDDDDKIILDRLIPKQSSQQKRQEAQSTSSGVAPSKKRVPPKLTAPDRPMTSPDSSKRKSEQAHDTQGGAKVPDRADQKSPIMKPSIPEPRPRASQSSLMSKLIKSETASDKRDTNRPAEVPPTPRSAEPRTSQGPALGKRYEPTPPSPQPVAPSQREATPPAEPKGPTLRQRISEKLFAPKPGVSSSRQRAMMLLVPILAIIMIFLFRQVLSKSPHEIKGADTTETPAAIEADSDRAIEWKIPEPLPATMRDPTKLLTQDDEPEQPVEPTETKVKLINVGTIVFSRDRASAIVNGRIVHNGDVVNGVTIVRINKDSVQCEKDGEKWVEKVRD